MHKILQTHKYEVNEIDKLIIMTYYEIRIGYHSFLLLGSNSGSYLNFVNHYNCLIKKGNILMFHLNFVK